MAAGYGTATYMSPSTTQIAGKVGLQTIIKSPVTNVTYTNSGNFPANHQMQQQSMIESTSPRHQRSGNMQTVVGSPGQIPLTLVQHPLLAGTVPRGMVLPYSAASGGVLAPHMGTLQHQAAYDPYHLNQYGGAESPPPENMSPLYQVGSGDMQPLNMQLSHQIGPSMQQPHYPMLQGPGLAMGFVAPNMGLVPNISHQSMTSYHNHAGTNRSHSQQDSPMTGVQMQQSPVPSS